MNDKKYIEANDLLKHLPNEPYKGAIRRVLQQAHAADVVDVVRCRDCAWARKVDYREPMFRCVNICRDGCTQWLDSNDFCSYGERRSE